MTLNITSSLYHLHMLKAGLSALVIIKLKYWPRGWGYASVSKHVCFTNMTLNLRIHIKLGIACSPSAMKQKQAVPMDSFASQPGQNSEPQSHWETLSSGDEVRAIEQVTWHLLWHTHIHVHTHAYTYNIDYLKNNWKMPHILQHQIFSQSLIFLKKGFWFLRQGLTM